jgi:hypothetical protein
MKRFSCFILLLFLVCQYFYCQTNVALNAKVLSSNITNWSTLAPKALDGSTSTSLYVNATVDNYFIFDLASIYSISKFKVTFGTKRPPEFDISTSTDNVNFTQIYSADGFAGTKEITGFSLPGNINQHRYIKFNFNPYVAHKIDADLLEIEIYGTKCFTFAYSYDDSGDRTSRTILLTEATGTKSELIYDSIQNNLSGSFKPEDKFTDQLEESKITIYPNPTRGELVVQTSNFNPEEKMKIVIVDINGRIILQKTILKEYTDIDLTNKPSGTYLLKIHSNSNSSDWTIIKQ